MSEHPDLEALSAHLDGEDDSVTAHVRGCAACQAQLAGLAEVRAAVGVPPDRAPTGAEEDAVRAAVAARATPDIPGRRFPARWMAAGAVAAVAAGVVVVLAVKPASHHNETALQQGTGASGSEQLVINGGDLGDVGDAAVLRAKVEPLLHPGVVAGGGTAGGTGSAAPAAPGSRDAAQPETHTLSSAAPRPVVPAPALRCESAARALQPGVTQTLVYTASARWQGTPAEVLAFSAAGPTTTAPGRQAPVRVYVMAARGCRLLVFQSYAP